MKQIDAVALDGTLVRLEPLGPGHIPGLMTAAEEDRSTYDWSGVPRAAQVADYVATRLATDGLTPYAQVRVSDGAPVGVTCLYSRRAWPGREDVCVVEIGGTWLGGSAQRTGINAEAKLLLMTYSFEDLGVARVEWVTDARNERSRRAIAALGATFEGVLRNFSPSRAPGEEGLLRDSAMYSVTDAEWPAVRDALTNRIADGGRKASGAEL